LYGRRSWSVIGNGKGSPPRQGWRARGGLDGRPYGDRRAAAGATSCAAQRAVLGRPGTVEYAYEHGLSGGYWSPGSGSAGTDAWSKAEYSAMRPHKDRATSA